MRRFVLVAIGAVVLATAGCGGARQADQDMETAADRMTAEGRIVSVDGEELVLMTNEGSELSFDVEDDVLITDLDPGDVVVIEYEGEGEDMVLVSVAPDANAMTTGQRTIEDDTPETAAGTDDATSPGAAPSETVEEDQAWGAGEPRDESALEREQDADRVDAGGTYATGDRTESDVAVGTDRAEGAYTESAETLPGTASRAPLAAAAGLLALVGAGALWLLGRKA
jgi:hypothetical protein